MTHATFPPSVARALCALGALSVMACRSLDGFSSKPGEAYCGSIGSPLFQDGFVKDGAMPTLQLALRLDINKLNSEPSSDPRDGSFLAVGYLRSHEGDDPVLQNGLCGDQALFADAPVRAIPQVDRDALSAFTFGEGHDHDFFAWVDSSCQGTMLAVVSLLKNDQVEMRLFKPEPTPPPNAPANTRPGFAVFHLNPKPLYASPDDGGCGFPLP